MQLTKAKIKKSAGICHIGPMDCIASNKRIGMLGGNGGGGVAYAAHVGGFLAGLVLVKFFVNKVQE